MTRTSKAKQKETKDEDIPIDQAFEAAVDEIAGEIIDQFMKIFSRNNPHEAVTGMVLGMSNMLAAVAAHVDDPAKYARVFTVMFDEAASENLPVAIKAKKARAN